MFILQYVTGAIVHQDHTEAHTEWVGGVGVGVMRLL